MRKFTDWKGNEIKDGDVILTVRIKPLFTHMALFFIETRMLTDYVKTQPEYIWEPLSEQQVIQFGHELWVKSNIGEMTITSPLDIMFAWRNSDTEIICIKGVSDNEQDFYTNYFKS